MLLDRGVYPHDCKSPSSGIGSTEVGFHRLVLTVLMEDFCGTRKQKLTQADIDAFWKEMEAALRRSGKEPPKPPAFDAAAVEAKLAEVREKLNPRDISWLERVTLQGEERSHLAALEHKSARAGVAYEELIPLRCKEALYKKYGGKVVAMQISIEPAEAYLKLVQDAEKSGKLKFLDKKVEAAFRKRMNNTLANTAVPPESVDFSLPAILQAR